MTERPPSGYNFLWKFMTTSDILKCQDFCTLYLTRVLFSSISNIFGFVKNNITLGYHKHISKFAKNKDLFAIGECNWFQHDHFNKQLLFNYFRYSGDTLRRGSDRLVCIVGFSNAKIILVKHNDVLMAYTNFGYFSCKASIFSSL